MTNHLFKSPSLPQSSKMPDLSFTKFPYVLGTISHILVHRFVCMILNKNLMCKMKH